MRKISSLIQPRTELLTEIKDKISFFAELPEYSAELYCHKKMKTDKENALTGLELVLKEAISDSNSSGNWFSQSLYEKLCAVAAANGLKNSQILWPVRTALSGKDVSPGGATELAEILGYDESISRIKKGIEKLRQCHNL